MTVLMRSPEGEEHDVPEAGVAALTHLGWEQVEQVKKAPAEKAAAKRATKRASK